MGKKGKKYTVGRFLIDLGLTMVTGGIWALWLFYKFIHEMLNK